MGLKLCCLLLIMIAAIVPGESGYRSNSMSQNRPTLYHGQEAVARANSTASTKTECRYFLTNSNRLLPRCQA